MAVESMQTQICKTDWEEKRFSESYQFELTRINQWIISASSNMNGHYTHSYGSSLCTMLSIAMGGGTN